MALGAVGATLGAAFPAQAQVQRAFTQHFGGDVRGDIVMTGNSVIRPISTSAVTNNNQDSKYVDIDGDPSTLNSSSAQLKLPVSGANILWARLYWSGRYDPAITTAPTTETINFSANGSAAGYQTYSATGSQLTSFPAPQNYGGLIYTATVDVTPQMKAASATPTLLAGNLTGFLYNNSNVLGAYAGWSVVVAYRDSSQTDVRQLRVFDGVAVINGTTNVPLSISGFRTPDTGPFSMRFGSVAFEGDRGITGDSLIFNGSALTDAINPSNDYFNSTVSQDGTLFSGELNPPPQNSSIFAVDADRTTISGPSAQIDNAATTANLTFTTSADVYFPTTLTTSIPTFIISGHVFEDPNYGGGAGRAFDTSKGMTGVANARVELYSATNNAFLGATTTDASGTYYFYSASPGQVKVRIVNSSVQSNRAGATSALVPVQTFRTDATGNLDSYGSGTAVEVTNKVGGESPSTVDPAANTTSATLPANSESVTTVTLGDGPVSNVDFGFNFDTVVNTSDAGQGSLRQFVLNANALSNAGLAQENLTAGTETSIFMIPAAALTNDVAKITLASTLTITGANANSTAIDGTTQTRNIGDTNTGTFGTGGTVGVDAIALPTLPRPEIEIYGPRSILIGLDIAAGSALVKGVAMWGFGDAGNTSTRATIRLGSGSTSAYAASTITQVLLGTSAVPVGGALFVPGNYGSGDLVSGNGVDNCTVSNSILAYCGGKGVDLKTGADGWTLQGNEIRNNSRDSVAWDGIDAQVANTKILENLVTNSGGTGIDSFSTGTGATIRNNTSRDNGQKCTPATGEPAGIRSYGTNNIIDRNLVFNNFGAGVLVQSTATTKITRNSIYNNGAVFSSASAGAVSGQVGIDLLNTNDDISHGTSPFITPNDAGDADTGGNGLLNFPVITGASIADGQLTLQGFAPAGSTVEVFIAQPDPSGFGQGKTFVFSLVEGSGADLDTTTGSYNATTLQTSGYSASVAALTGSETNANKFKIVVSAGAITASSLLTATATIGNSTSEFSPVLTRQTGQASISGLVYLDANANAKREPSESGASLTGFFIKLVPDGATTATSATPVNADGTYAFTNPTPGTYSLVLDNNATLTDIAPTTPAGLSATEAPNGVRGSVVVTNLAIPAQNFGLYAGFSLSGRVFEDNGSGGGIANDGLQNGSEPGIGGVQLQLKSGTTLLGTATSAPDGTYLFSVPATNSGQTLAIVELNATGFVSSGGSVGNTTGTYDRPSDTLTFPFNTANGTLTNVNFADVRGAVLENDGAKIGIRGGSVVYPHVFTAGTSGSVSFSLSQIATPAPGWTVALYNDLNGNGILDAGEPPILSSSPPIAASASGKINLLVINYVPQNAPDGSQDKITLSASFVPSVGGSNPALPAQVLTRGDLTTVGPQSGLNLVKAVDKTSAKSGDLITYTLTYSNISNTPISALVVNDATPAFTTFSSATFATPPNNLTTPVITAPSVGAGGSIKWTFGGTLAPGASGTVTFVVKVN